MTTDNVIKVNLWGETIGALFLNPDTLQTFFEFEPNYKSKERLLAPLTMPFPKVDKRIFGPYYDQINDPFNGLPSMIADSLPDSYGSAVIRKYLIENGHSEIITPIRFLSYIGTRGMGALEFIPASKKNEKGLIDTDLSNLANLSNAIIEDRKDSFKITKEDLFKLFQFSTSAGGAKPKAILSFNKNKNIYSYPYQHKDGFTPLIIKFDGLNDKGISHDSGRIEYIYYKMAIKCGIKMTSCGFFNDSTKSHFYTTRFDRTIDGEKLHMQTLAGLTGLNPRLLHNYDVVFDTILKLGLSQADLKQQFKILVFNYLSSNDDYHIKNISFLMDKNGQWSLSPAYDITFPYQVTNIWVRTQPLSINGKVKNIEDADFLTIAKKYGIKHPLKIIATIKEELGQFKALAQKYQLPEYKAQKVESCFRF